MLVGVVGEWWGARPDVDVEAQGVLEVGVWLRLDFVPMNPQNLCIIFRRVAPDFCRVASSPRESLEAATLEFLGDIGLEAMTVNGSNSNPRQLVPTSDSLLSSGKRTSNRMGMGTADDSVAGSRTLGSRSVALWGVWQAHELISCKFVWNTSWRLTASSRARLCSVATGDCFENRTLLGESCVERRSS
jgi:hypothetical protein